MSDGSAEEDRTELATLGGGCFWCLQPLFDQLKGVDSVEVGYAGGRIKKPSYEMVCTGLTGHAEVVQIRFHPETISYEEILQVFFTMHDPTTPNRQGADVGTQYRSIILFHSEAQKAAAQKVIEELTSKRLWDDPIVTQVVPFGAFYRAEDYHQDYFRKNPGQGYCRAVVAPKVAKFRSKYLQQLKDPKAVG